MQKLENILERKRRLSWIKTCEEITASQVVRDWVYILYVKIEGRDIKEEKKKKRKISILMGLEFVLKMGEDGNIAETIEITIQTSCSSEDESLDI